MREREQRPTGRLPRSRRVTLIKSITPQAMRYNPETERGITLEQISHSCWRAVDHLTTPRAAVQTRVWDCANGGWIDQVQFLPVGCPHVAA